MQTKEIIRCRRLHCNAEVVMNESEVNVALCNGIEKQNCVFQKNVELILDRCKSVSSIQIYDNLKLLLEDTKEQDIIFYMLRAAVEDELKASDELKKRYRNSKIIFVSADGVYLKEAYKAQPFRYLYLDDSIEEIQEALSSAIYCNREKKGVVLEGDGKYYYILLKDILYVEALGDEIGIYAIDANEYVIRMTLKHMLHILPQGEFIRVSRQKIVNARHIKRLVDVGAILSNAEEAVISGRERKKVIQKYTEYLAERELYEL